MFISLCLHLKNQLQADDIGRFVCSEKLYKEAIEEKIDCHLWKKYILEQLTECPFKWIESSELGKNKQLMKR